MSMLQLINPSLCHLLSLALMPSKQLGPCYSLIALYSLPLVCIHSKVDLSEEAKYGLCMQHY